MTNKNNKAGFFEDLKTVASEATERKNPVAEVKTEAGQPKPPSNFYQPPGTEKKEENEKDKKTETVEAEKKIDAEKSGQTAAIICSGSIETLFKLAERIVYIKQFTQEEKEKIVLIQDKDESDLDDKEKTLNRKFMRINKQHEKIMDKIDFDDDEVHAMAKGFTEYTRVTGKELSPNLILWSTIINAICSRSIDIFM